MSVACADEDVKAAAALAGVVGEHNLDLGYRFRLNVRELGVWAVL
jgi:hypothetical protein